MRTEAQKKALNEYRKKTKQVVVRFYPNSEDDEALYLWIKGQENATEYLKSLARADMRASEG